VTGRAERVTIIGGSGYVGQLLRRGLGARGFTVDVFDPVQGPVVTLLRRRWFAGAPASPLGRVARAAQRWAEPRLISAGVIRRGSDDMLADRELIARRLAGSRAVIHLAGIPHPHWPGATDETFVRLNYDAAINVFEAARDAGVPTFVFASSAQVYAINDPVRLNQLPIRESNHLPLPAEGQTTYGFLKGAFERYLDGACSAGSGTQAVALRLECPGFRGPGAANLYVSTSVENTIDGFARALRPPDDLRYDVFNLADADVDPAIVDIRAFVRRRWAYVPTDLRGPNPCLLSVEKAQRVLGYRPITNGRYIDAGLVW
jgi:nucleoside-diphosphate-sugar epimerase